MERHFDEQLTALKAQLVKMSALAELMIGDAVKVLVSRDAATAAAVAHHETEVNDLQIEVDEMCLTLIATHQPVAADLRFLVGAIKTNNELERLADLEALLPRWRRRQGLSQGSSLAVYARVQLHQGVCTGG